MGDPTKDTSTTLQVEPGIDQLAKDREQVRSILRGVQASDNPDNLTDNLDVLEQAVREITHLVTDVQQFADFTPEIKQLIRHTREIKNKGPQQKKEKPPETPPPSAEPKQAPPEKVDPVAQKKAEREANRAEIQQVIDEYLKTYRENKGKRFSQMVGIEDLRRVSKREVTVKVAKFVEKIHRVISLFPNVSYKTSKGFALTAEEQEDDILVFQANRLAEYAISIRNELLKRSLDPSYDVIIDFDAAQNGQTPPPPKQERTHQVDRDEQVIIISLLENLRNVAHTEQNPLQVAQREIDDLFSRSPSIPTWFRLLKTKLEKISEKVGNNPYDTAIQNPDFNELDAIDPRLITLFTGILQSAIEKEQKKWSRFELEVFSDEALKTITKFFEVATWLNENKTSPKTHQPIPEQLVSRWKSGIQKITEALEGTNIYTITSKQTEQLLSYFVTQHVRTKVGQLILEEIPRKKKEAVRTQLLLNLQSSKTLFDALHNLKSFPEFAEEYKALKDLQNFFLSKGKESIFHEKNMPPSVIFFSETNSFWQKISDSDIQTLFHGLFNAWALEQQEKWWQEIEQLRERFKGLFSDKVTRILPLYVDRILSQTDQLNATFTPEKVKYLKEAILQRLSTFTQTQVQTLNLSGLSGKRVEVDAEFISTDQRFSTSLIENIVSGKVDFRFSPSEKASWRNINPKNLSEPVWHICNQIFEALFKESLLLSKTIEYLAKENIGLFIQENRRSLGVQPKYEELIIPVLTARALSKTETQPQLSSRQQAAQRYRLSHMSYVFLREELDATSWQSAIDFSIDYIVTSFHISRDTITEMSKDLRLPPSQESLIRLLDSALSTPDGILEFADKRAFYVPPEGEIYNKRGFIHSENGLENNLLFGTQIAWLKWKTANQETRKNAMDEVFREGKITYQIIGFFNSNERTALSTRLDSLTSTLIQPNYSSISLDIPIRDIVTKEEFESLSQACCNLDNENFNNRNRVIERIYILLNKSQKALQLAKDINIFVQEQVSALLRNPEEYLEQFEIPFENRKLQVVDWFNIIFNLVVGRFDDLSTGPKPKLIRSSDQHLVPTDLLPVIQYARNLRSAA